MALMSIVFCSNAQHRLIPNDLKTYTLQVGDTIIFKYSNPDKMIVPKYDGYNADYANLAYYLEGYMSNTYHYVKQKKNVNGGFIYHGTYSIDGGRYYKSGTPLSDINNHNLIVINTNSFFGRGWDNSLYYEIRLLNTAFNDTLIFRCVEYNTRTTKPTTVSVPKLERLMKEELVDKKFYTHLSKDDAEYDSDRMGYKLKSTF